MSIQLKRGTQSNWESVNPVLADGQPGVVTSTLFGNEVTSMKIGDGTSTFTNLPFIDANEHIELIDGADLNASTGPTVTPGTYILSNVVNAPIYSGGNNVYWLLKVNNFYSTYSSSTYMKVSQFLVRLTDGESGGPKLFYRVHLANQLNNYLFKQIFLFGNTFSSSNTYNIDTTTTGLMFLNSNLNGNIIPATTTQINNLLDLEGTVETGTWTPSITFTTSGLTVTPVSGACIYSRVNNLCYLKGQFSVSGTGNSGLSAFVSGLPFVADRVGNNDCGLSVYFGLSSPSPSSTYYEVKGVLRNSAIYFLPILAGGAFNDNMTFGDFSDLFSGYTVYISGVYPIDVS